MNNHYYIKPEKTVFDRGRIDHISLTYNFDLDLQSLASCGHDLLAGKSSRSVVSRFQTQSGNKQMEGPTDGWR